MKQFYLKIIAAFIRWRAARLLRKLKHANEGALRDAGSEIERLKAEHAEEIDTVTQIWQGAVDVAKEKAEADTREICEGYKSTINYLKAEHQQVQSSGREKIQALQSDIAHLENINADISDQLDAERTERRREREEFESTVKLKDKEISHLLGIIERDRARVAAERSRAEAEQSIAEVPQLQRIIQQ